MATIAGTPGEKIDQLTQLAFGQQAQISLLKTVGAFVIPALIAFNGWIAISVTSTQRDVASTQVEVKAMNQRLDKIEKTLDRIDERLGRLEKMKAGE